jgi:two-component system nitrogen regulation sensor histidine kinase GlnL
MQGKTVLIVDDDQVYRESLREQLQKLGASAACAASGKEAIDLVESDPSRFQFAVVDQLLDHGLTGIETTARLVDFNRDLFVVVFTNVASDNKEAIAQYRYQALSAGAFRYLEHDRSGPPRRQIEDFVAEMNQLARLRDLIREHYENRSSLLPSLLTQLSIGVDVIDSSYKVWYMNRTLRQIIGLADEQLPKGPCSSWHGYKCCPCPRCLVEESRAKCAPGDRYFLSPLPRRGGDLYFMRVWAQPACDDSGKVLLDGRGKPLAIMESVQDLTGSELWHGSSLDFKLMHVAEALYSLPLPECYLPRPCFEKVRIFLGDRTHGDRLILKAAEGFSTRVAIGAPLDRSSDAEMMELLTLAEENVKAAGAKGRFFQKLGGRDPLFPLDLRERFIYWPVLDGGRTIALVEAIGDNCCEERVELLRPYVEKVAEALRGEGVGVRLPSTTADSSLAEIDLGIQTTASLSPRKALKFLVSECCRLTGGELPILRYREGQEAVLVRLGLSDYDEVAVERISVAKLSSWSARTILSGQVQRVNTADHGDRIFLMREDLEPAASTRLAGVASLCFLPLILDGQCIGSLGLHGRRWNTFGDEQERVARAIATRLASALHDYSVEQRIRRQVEAAQDSTIGVALHNINDPLGTINNDIGGLVERARSGMIDTERLLNTLERIKRQAERIGDVRSEYLRLRSPWQGRIEDVDLHDLIQGIARDCSVGRNIAELTFELEPSFTRVRADSTAIRVCLEVLLGNAFDAVKDYPSGQIAIKLRIAEQYEWDLADSAGPHIAIDVSDNGPGIPLEMEERLFQFAKSFKSKGRGLGLPYCHHVVTSAGGAVYHYKGQIGARFTLIFPIRSATKGQEDYKRDV